MAYPTPWLWWVNSISQPLPLPSPCPACHGEAWPAFLQDGQTGSPGGCCILELHDSRLTLSEWSLQNRGELVSLDPRTVENK